MRDAIYRSSFNEPALHMYDTGYKFTVTRLKDSFEKIEQGGNRIDYLTVITDLESDDLMGIWLLDKFVQKMHIIVVRPPFLNKDQDVEFMGICEQLFAPLECEISFLHGTIASPNIRYCTKHYKHLKSDKDNSLNDAISELKDFFEGITVPENLEAEMDPVGINRPLQDKKKQIFYLDFQSKTKESKLNINPDAPCFVMTQISPGVRYVMEQINAKQVYFIDCPFNRENYFHNTAPNPDPNANSETFPYPDYNFPPTGQMIDENSLNYIGVGTSIPDKQVAMELFESLKTNLQVVPSIGLGHFHINRLIDVICHYFIDETYVLDDDNYYKHLEKVFKDDEQVKILNGKISELNQEVVVQPRQLDANPTEKANVKALLEAIKPGLLDDIVKIFAPIKEGSQPQRDDIKQFVSHVPSLANIEVKRDEPSMTERETKLKTWYRSRTQGPFNSMVMPDFLEEITAWDTQLPVPNAYRIDNTFKSTFSKQVPDISYTDLCASIVLVYKLLGSY